MCGIAGSYPNPDPKTLTRSLNSIRHRGPDAQNILNNEQGSLAHSRLAILDVDHAHQPMQRHGATLVFNGEIYNFKHLLATVAPETPQNSDTTAILALYRALGPEMVALLDGMFAFALVQDGQLFLARDPLGIKPLYLAITPDTLYFASELKALTGIPGELHEFPAGHWWHSSAGLQRYYEIPPGNLAGVWADRDEATVYPRIHDGLEEAVHKRLLADSSVAVGVSLSGGLDSSLVAALARPAQERLLTFAVGTPASEDLAMASRLADRLGAQHHPFEYNATDMLAALPEIIYHLESYDAALVRSAIPNYFLARHAAQQVKVILTGEGADEIFAGYESLRPITDPDHLQRELVQITGRLHNTNLQRADRMGMAFGLEARVPFLDKAFVRASLSLPAKWKLQTRSRPEKALLRRAFQGLLPQEILWRKKAKFSSGAGSATLLTEHAQRHVSDRDYAAARQSAPWAPRSKEETLYYRIFASHFGDQLPARLVGRTRTLAAGELA